MIEAGSRLSEKKKKKQHLYEKVTKERVVQSNIVNNEMESEVLSDSGCPNIENKYVETESYEVAMKDC